eukprot:Tbor_TRINITY_DN6030_c1_g6::TRINITY_DN6030_c1_g6_i1::g.11097::m.11097/K03015/RPB7, POLR2G; DNA-directed RNA polymerase II subunit RPB7
MYLRVILHKTILLSPQDLGATVKVLLEDMLKDSVEGKTIPGIGLVIAITEILENGSIEGKIVDSGDVAFLLNYEAIVFKAFDGEVMDVVVREILPDSFYASAGPYNVRVQVPLSTGFVYDKSGVMPKFVCQFEGSTEVIMLHDKVRVQIIRETPNAVKHYGALANLVSATGVRVVDNDEFGNIDNIVDDFGSSGIVESEYIRNE